jgi:hypothetical protein
MAEVEGIVTKRGARFNNAGDLIDALEAETGRE